MSAATSQFVSPPAASPAFGWLRGFAWQALIWIGLTIAFAALLRLAGPQSWASALRFAGTSWLPWIVLAPIVYWFSGHFPLERAQLWKSIPAHVLGCAACIAVTLSVTTYIGYVARPAGPRFEDRRPPLARPSFEHEMAPPATGAPDAATRLEAANEAAPEPPRREWSERFPRGENRARRGPFWWPFLGVTLIRANFDAAIYLIVVVAAHALAFYRRAQDREQHAVTLAAGLARAKLDALRLQLQPHFLFNTLNAISTLVHRDANAADELIGDLSDLLRLSLQTTQHEVPLRRELELLDRYLAIEQARLGARLQVEKRIDADTESALVPTLLLQPIVENSIRHGIEPRVAPGKVSIRARREGARLVLTVEDDGVGFAGANATGARRGIGLTNSEERLRALHGDAAELTIASPDAGGVSVRVVLPFTTMRSAEPMSSATTPAPRP